MLFGELLCAVVVSAVRFGFASFYPNEKNMLRSIRVPWEMRFWVSFSSSFTTRLKFAFAFP